MGSTMWRFCVLIHDGLPSGGKFGSVGLGWMVTRALLGDGGGYLQTVLSQ